MSTRRSADSHAATDRGCERGSHRSRGPPLKRGEKHTTTAEEPCGKGQWGVRHFRWKVERARRQGKTRAAQGCYATLPRWWCAVAGLGQQQIQASKRVAAVPSLEKKRRKKMRRARVDPVPEWRIWRALHLGRAAAAAPLFHACQDQRGRQHRKHSDCNRSSNPRHSFIFGDAVWRRAVCCWKK